MIFEDNRKKKSKGAGPLNIKPISLFNEGRSLLVNDTNGTGKADLLGTIDKLALELASAVDEMDKEKK
jgi:hypothetical protein